MGSAQLDLILNYHKEKDVVIIDHHVPLANLPLPSSFVHLNPHLFNHGDTCAACLAYLVARQLGADKNNSNADLAGLAIVGALGDKQEMDIGLNKQILDEAQRNGVISVNRGLKQGEGKIKDLLFFSTDPYIEIAGEEEKVNAFLQGIGINGECNTEELRDEDQRRLINGLLSLSSADEDKDIGVNEDRFLGPVCMLEAEVVRNSINFMELVDASGRLGKAGVALGLCMKEEEMIPEAESLYRKFQSKLVSELKRIRVGKERVVKEKANIFYLYVQEKNITGILAGVIAKYLYTKKPIIVLNKKEGAETKISARCNKEMLLSAGITIDLADAMEKAAKEVGGVGGGHPVASGASIPESSEENFIAIIDRLIGTQK
jgi:single-stranded DNA-specific DHH superfamily exonuclease